MFKKYINLNKLSSLIFYLSILSFIIGFNFSDNAAGGWYQQVLPNIVTSSISDVTFPVPAESTAYNTFYYLSFYFPRGLREDKILKL